MKPISVSFCSRVPYFYPSIEGHSAAHATVILGKHTIQRGAHRTSRTDPTPYKYRTIYGKAVGPRTVRHRTAPYDTVKHRTIPQKDVRHRKALYHTVTDNRMDVRSTVQKTLLPNTPGHRTLCRTWRFHLKFLLLINTQKQPGCTMSARGRWRQAKWACFLFSLL